MPAPDGFRCHERRGPDGSIETEQRVALGHPVVPFTDEGGLALGRAYWLEVRRASKGLVRFRESRDGVELTALGVGPPLLRLGVAKVTLGSNRVSCCYPIRGGLLSRRAGGALVVSQVGRDRSELRVVVRGFFARLGGGHLYRQLQRRVHLAVSRRYLRRLLTEKAP